ncbi:MAG: CinA family protein [Pseudomonadota bacterium]|nr:damage-inducible protein CinA [Euryarchaeota archaeon]MEC7208007.1 CinA family protein [Pseudomonadota bacterium]
MTTNADDLIEHLTETGKTLCTVESCTGGLVFSTLTAVAGASAVLDRGFITYSNQAKQDMVGVTPETLARFGAVSQQTAAEMAKGGQKTAGTDLSVSLTGIAGPGGGTPDKPVGLVWISACSEDGRQITEHHQFSGDRQQIRQAACDAAIELLQKLSAG